MQVFCFRMFGCTVDCYILFCLASSDILALPSPNFSSSLMDGTRQKQMEKLEAFHRVCDVEGDNGKDATDCVWTS